MYMYTYVYMFSFLFPAEALSRISKAGADASEMDLFPLDLPNSCPFGYYILGAFIETLQERFQVVPTYSPWGFMVRIPNHAVTF